MIVALEIEPPVVETETEDAVKGAVEFIAPGEASVSAPAVTLPKVSPPAPSRMFAEPEPALRIRVAKSLLAIEPRLTAPPPVLRLVVPETTKAPV